MSILCFSDASHALQAEAAQTGAHQGLPPHGRGVHPQSGASQAAGGEGGGEPSPQRRCHTASQAARCFNLPVIISHFTVIVENVQYNFFCNTKMYK